VDVLHVGPDGQQKRGKVTAQLNVSRHPKIGSQWLMEQISRRGHVIGVWRHCPATQVSVVQALLSSQSVSSMQHSSIGVKRQPVRGSQSLDVQGSPSSQVTGSEKQKFVSRSQ
jgi:hypothetical protein